MLGQTGCRIAVTMTSTIVGFSSMAKGHVWSCVAGARARKPWPNLTLIQSGACTRRVYYKGDGKGTPDPHLMVLSKISLQLRCKVDEIRVTAPLANVPNRVPLFRR